MWQENDISCNTEDFFSAPLGNNFGDVSTGLERFFVDETPQISGPSPYVVQTQAPQNVPPQPNVELYYSSMSMSPSATNVQEVLLALDRNQKTNKPGLQEFFHLHQPPVEVPKRTRVQCSPEDDEDDDDEDLKGEDSVDEGEQPKSRRITTPRGVLPEDEKRKKHNSAEARRRKKLNSTFKDLAKLVDCGHTSKSAVLKAAVHKVESLTEHIKNLQVQIAAYQWKDQALSANVKQLSEERDKNVTLMARMEAAQRCISALELRLLQSRRPTRGLEEELSAAQSAMEKPVQLIEKIARLSGLDRANRVDHSYLFNQSHVARTVANLSGRIIDCNELFAALVQYPRSVLIAENATTKFELTHPDSLAVSFAMIGKLLQSQAGTVQRAQKKYVTSKGYVQCVLLTCWVSVDPNGRPEYINALVQPLQSLDDTPSC